MGKEDYKNVLKNNIDQLKEQINDIKMEFDKPLDMIDGVLPNLDMDKLEYNYDQDMQIIKDDAEETLECISSLYLNNKMARNKNINRLIKNDAEEISDIKFSLSCAKRGLISCMRHIDAGTKNPDMHNAVNAYQKEIRESNKMLHDLLNKMKIFYKDLREELKTDEEINLGKDVNPDDDLKLIDKSEFNDIIEKYKKDPTLLK